MASDRRAPLRQVAQVRRAWPIFQLPRWLVAVIAAVVLADAIAISRALVHVTFRGDDLLIFALLLACGTVTVERSRKLTESALVAKDVFGVWELPMAILLPPLYVLIAPIPRMALTQWRIRKVAPHRRIYTAASISLSYYGAYLAFHQVSRLSPPAAPGHAGRSAVWVLAVTAAFAVQWAINSLLVAPAIKGSDPSARITALMLHRESLHNDFTEICVATAVTLGALVNPIAIVLALPFVTLLQRSSWHAQLVATSRIDGKTGLLNAETWRRESESELARARRSGLPLAVALIDIDHFKTVNDVFGHLAGDDALRALTAVLRSAVRDGDLVGRFGGEEFTLLLQQTDQAGAQAMAERIRAQVGDLRIDVGAHDPVTLTVSIGVAATSEAGEPITELLAAADAALYRAKQAGRNQVRA